MSPRPSLRALVSLALGAAAALALGRLVILVLHEHVLRDAPLDDALWRVTHDMIGLALHALVAGAGLALVAAARARVAGHLAGTVALLVGAALCFSALSGHPVAPSYQTPHPSTDRGLLALIAIAGASIVLAVVTGFAARRASWLGRPFAPRALALVFALPLLGAWLVFGRVAPLRSVRQVVEETAFEPERWDVARAHPRRAPELAVITPCADMWRDGRDMPGILMPPPCELSFDVPEAEGDLRLRLSAGVDQVAHQRHLAGDPPITVSFEVLIDGELRFEHEATVARDAPEEQRRWEHIGGAGGLALAPGARVTLRTRILAPEYSNENQLPVLAIGFGGVMFERTVERRRERASEDAPNIVLIVMDTLRQDALSCYGAAPGATPHLDALAARGMLFENAYATSSWTWPSTASILTGLYPESHGVEADGSCYLRGSFDTLPELLEERGYTTVAFTCNPLIVADHGFSQGFGEFDGIGQFRFSPVMIGRPLEWLEVNADSRFFAYVHLVDPHWPYRLDAEDRAALDAVKPADFPEQGLNDWHKRLVQGQGRDDEGNLLPDAVPPAHLEYMLAEYAAAVRAADRWVGAVIEKLEELGLDDRTIVAFTSDHGEEFIEHGLATHGNQLYPEVVRVPLLLAGPGVPAAERVSTYVSNRHVAPTLARFGGAPFPDLEAPQDLVRAGELSERYIFTSTHQGWWKGNHRIEIFGVTDGEWSLQWAPQGAPWRREPEPDTPGEWRLFHLANDPQETVDLSAAQPEKAAELLALLKAHLVEASKRRPALTVGIGQQGRDLFEKIGYTGGDEDDLEDDEPSEDGERSQR